jgi:hypothetical protein
VSSSNTSENIGEGMGNYWDISLEQGWSEGDIANLAMNALGMGDDSIIDEILWSKLGIMGQLLKKLNFDPNRCANCLRVANHRASECNENCRFCKKKAEHPSLMCELAPQDNLSWGQVLKAMDEKYPNANGKYMSKDSGEESQGGVKWEGGGEGGGEGGLKIRVKKENSDSILPKKKKQASTKKTWQEFALRIDYFGIKGKGLTT